MSTALIWIVVGILLILSELLATSIVAVFIGVGALVTGILLQFNVIESVTAQYLVFGVVSLASLVLARRRMKNWFVGYTNDENNQQLRFQQDLGERVTVSSNFKNGAGRVVLNGVQWDAESNAELQKGDVAWVTKNDGIKLSVSPTKKEFAEK